MNFLVAQRPLFFFPLPRPDLDTPCCCHDKSANLCYSRQTHTRLALPKKNHPVGLSA
jgi:hypothetical protein